jgi:hypothetical protein
VNTVTRMPKHAADSSSSSSNLDAFATKKQRLAPKDFQDVFQMLQVAWKEKWNLPFPVEYLQVFPVSKNNPKGISTQLFETRPQPVPTKRASLSISNTRPRAEAKTNQTLRDITVGKKIKYVVKGVPDKYDVSFNCKRC